MSLVARRNRILAPAGRRPESVSKKNLTAVAAEPALSTHPVRGEHPTGPRARWGVSLPVRMGLIVTAALVAGGAIGLQLNRPSAGAAAASLAPEPLVVSAEPVGLMSTGASELLLPPVQPAPEPRFAVEAVVVPPNPFEKTRPTPAAAGVGQPAAGGATRPAPAVAGPGAGVKPSGAKPAEPAAPAAPAVEELAVTGIVDGEPPLAVVRFSGRSLFLKIGDAVADTWRLVEIKERSVLFQLGARRVEVPIQGGGSQ